MSGLSLKSLTFTLMIVVAPALFAQNEPFGLSVPRTPAVDSTVAQKSGSLVGALKGRYTFAVHGALAGAQGGSRELGSVGSIVADGKGHIISGIADFQSAFGSFSKVSLTGSYSLDVDGIGTLTLTSNERTTTFSLLVSREAGQIQKATIVQTNRHAGTVGSLVRQEFVGAPSGNFAFSLSGETFQRSGVPDAIVVGGYLNITQGALVGVATMVCGDAANKTAKVIQNIAMPATLSSPDENGRFTLTFTFSPASAPGTPIQFAGYMVDANHFNLLPSDQPSGTVPLLIGSASK